MRRTHPIRSLLAAAAALLAPAGALAQPASFKVMITELQQLGPSFDLTGAIGDFYARVSIDGVTTDNSPSCSNQFSGALVPLLMFRNFFHSPDCFRTTPWIFTRELTPGTDPVPVTITILDSDSASADDTADAKRGPGSTVSLMVDPATGQWSGDFDWPQNCSRPGGFSAGELEGHNVAICWEIGFDRDGDGLLDIWETSGIDMDHDGTQDIDLQALGADPLHKDLFVELDWSLHPDPVIAPRLLPRQQGVRAVQRAFAEAPPGAGGQTNPDGTPGIRLWVDTGDLRDPLGAEDGGPPESCSDGLDNGGDGVTDTADDDCLVGDDLGGGNGFADVPIEKVSSPEFYQVRGANFDADAREFVFRYGISGSGCFGGGTAEAPGNDFLVCGFGNAASFMHEFGHTLSLRHGGDVDRNCKPNYISVMSYDHAGGILSTADAAVNALLLDYSPPRHDVGRGTAPLPALDENALFQDQVLDAGDADNLFVLVDQGIGACVGGADEGVFCLDGGACTSGVCAVGLKRTASLDAPVTWKSNDDDPMVAANVDTSDAFTMYHEDCTNDALTLLEGHDDWGALLLSFIELGDSRTMALLAPPPGVVEPTQEEIFAQQVALNSTDLAISKSAPASVEAGTMLVYTLAVTNLGMNHALAVQVLDTLPPEVSYVSDDAGCVEDPAGTLTCALGDLAPGEDRELSITVLADGVCSNGVPGTVVNTASVENDLDFAAETSPADNAVDVGVQAVDTTAPVVGCNTPATMQPRHAPLSFTATASDVCDDASVVEVLDYDCVAFTRKGRPIDKTSSCVVGFEGDTLTVLDSGGVGDHIVWTVRATDAAGNVAEAQCGVDVVRE